MKKFGIIAIEQDLIDFNLSRTSSTRLSLFLREYIALYKHELVENEDDVYSLLLNVTISLEDLEAIKFILKTKRGDMLVQQDGMGYSPFSQVLMSQNYEIRKLVFAHVLKFAHEKTECSREEITNILTAMKLTEIEMTRERYMSLFNALYTNTQVFRELLDTFDF